MVPAGVVDALCQRLQADRLGESLVMVKVTQPIVTSRSLGALFPVKGRPLELTPPPTRAIPIDIASGACKWRAIDAAQRTRYSDSVVVELSAPLLNPADEGEAGLFARITIGSATEWYWLSLVRQEESWLMGRLKAIGVP
jgi:hypothetical protein